MKTQDKIGIDNKFNKSRIIEDDSLSHNDYTNIHNNVNSNINNSFNLSLKDKESNYSELSLFNNKINIKKELLRNTKIVKTELEKFIYKKEAEELMDMNSNNKKKKKVNSVITEMGIYGNRINIEIEDLIFESNNHMKYFLTDIYKLKRVLGEGAFGVVVEAEIRFDSEIIKDIPQLSELIKETNKIDNNENSLVNRLSSKSINSYGYNKKLNNLNYENISVYNGNNKNNDNKFSVFPLSTNNKNKCKNSFNIQNNENNLNNQNNDYSSIRKNVALKILPVNNQKYSEVLKQEAFMLKKLNHPNIVKVFSVYENKNYIVIEFELMKGKTLKDEIIQRYVNNNNNNQFFTENECSSITKDLINGLAYLQRENIMHRDIKPDNLMFVDEINCNVHDENDNHTSMSLKIIDLGLAVKYESKLDSFFDKVGTLYFMAPEICSNKCSYNYLVDAWACGVVMFILLSGGEHPLKVYKYWKNGIFNEDAYVKALSGKLNFSFSNCFSNLARNLFMKLCNPNKLERYDVYLASKHPFLTRDVNSSIPESYIDRYNRKAKIKSFKKFLLSSVVLSLCKSKYTVDNSKAEQEKKDKQHNRNISPLDINSLKFEKRKALKVKISKTNKSTEVFSQMFKNNPKLLINAKTATTIEKANQSTSSNLYVNNKKIATCDLNNKEKDDTTSVSSFKLSEISNKNVFCCENSSVYSISPVKSNYVVRDYKLKENERILELSHISNGINDLNNCNNCVNCFNFNKCNCNAEYSREYFNNMNNDDNANDSNKNVNSSQLKILNNKNIKLKDNELKSNGKLKALGSFNNSKNSSLNKSKSKYKNSHTGNINSAKKSTFLSGNSINLYNDNKNVKDIKNSSNVCFPNISNNRIIFNDAENTSNCSNNNNNNHNDNNDNNDNNKTFSRVKNTHVSNISIKSINSSINNISNIKNDSNKSNNNVISKEILQNMTKINSKQLKHLISSNKSSPLSMSSKFIQNYNKNNTNSNNNENNNKNNITTKSDYFKYPVILNSNNINNNISQNNNNIIVKIKEKSKVCFNLNRNSIILANSNSNGDLKEKQRINIKINQSLNTFQSKSKHTSKSKILQ